MRNLIFWEIEIYLERLKEGHHCSSFFYNSMDSFQFRIALEVDFKDMFIRIFCCWKLNLLERLTHILKYFFCSFSAHNYINFVSFSNNFDIHLFISFELFHRFRVFFDFFELMSQILSIFSGINFNKERPLGYLLI